MWSMQAQFAGYALAAAKNPDLELLVRGSTAPLELLLRGEAEFCTASPAHLLAAGAKARSAALIALFMPRSPVRLVGSRRRRGDDLRNLANARIGVWQG